MALGIHDVPPSTADPQILPSHRYQPAPCGAEDRVRAGQGLEASRTREGRAIWGLSTSFRRVARRTAWSGGKSSPNRHSRTVLPSRPPGKGLRGGNGTSVQPLLNRRHAVMPPARWRAADSHESKRPGPCPIHRVGDQHVGPSSAPPFRGIAAGVGRLRPGGFGSSFGTGRDRRPSRHEVSQTLIGPTRRVSEQARTAETPVPFRRLPTAPSFPLWAPGGPAWQPRETRRGLLPVAANSSGGNCRLP